MTMNHDLQRQPPGCAYPLSTVPPNVRRIRVVRLRRLSVEISDVPNRIIREVGLTSRKLAAISDFGERLYWRLYQAADDFGRFHGDPKLILARCFPLML